MVTSNFFHIAGLYLGLHPANERRRYKVNAVSHWLGANLESALYRINTGVPTEHSCTTWLATPTDHRIQKRKIINKSSGHNERGLTPLDYQGTKGYQYIMVHYCTLIRNKIWIKTYVTLWTQQKYTFTSNSHGQALWCLIYIYTVECHYKAVQFTIVLHTALQWLW